VATEVTAEAVRPRRCPRLARTASFSPHVPHTSTAPPECVGRRPESYPRFRGEIPVGSSAIMLL